MDQKLNEFVQKLKNAGKENLRAVVLYGSAVTEEFHPKHSDLNTLCILDQTSTDSIEALHECVEWWIQQGHRPPLLFTLEEIRRSSDIFAIELMDMKLHHRMLWGEDFFPSLVVPLRYHALQVERELRTGCLRLRQGLLVAGKNKSHLNLMLESFSAFTTLFRHALMALGESPVSGKREAIDRVATLVHGDPGGFHAILELHAGTRKQEEIDFKKTLKGYLALVEAVTNEVDGRLEAGS